MPKAAHPTHLKNGHWRIRWLDEQGARQSDVFTSFRSLREGGGGGENASRRGGCEQGSPQELVRFHILRPLILVS